jgi:hypothetical protein
MLIKPTHLKVNNRQLSLIDMYRPPIRREMSQMKNSKKRMTMRTTLIFKSSMPRLKFNLIRMFTATLGRISAQNHNLPWISTMVAKRLLMLKT